MYTLRAKKHFDAAHLLPYYGGKCRRLHGHRWEVEVVLEATELNEDGFVVDFSIVKDLIDQVVPDHKPLNAGQYIQSLLPMFPEYKAELTMVASVLGNWLSNPTAENIAEAVYVGIQKEIDLQELDVNLIEVTIWESPNCSVTYRPDFDLSDTAPYSFFTKPHVAERFPPFTLDNVTERYSNENP